MRTILVVDDDEKLCSILSEELNEIGFISNYKTSAEDALGYLLENRVDLILLDLKMPDKDGYYVLSMIKEHKIKTKIIVLTAYADLSGIIQSSHLGAIDFISKPYDFDELLITIRKVLFE